VEDTLLSEVYVWRAVFWTILVTGVVALAASLDPGFLAYYQARGVVAVSTGDRIEVVASGSSAFSRQVSTQLYAYDDAHGLKKTASLADSFQCVTGYNGQLLIVFQNDPDQPVGGPSSIYKDGKWVRGYASPVDLRIIDVAPFKGVVCAIALDRQSRFVATGLGPSGWQVQGDPVDLGKDAVVAGCQGFDKEFAVLYYTGPVTSLGVPDLEKAEWHLVGFDGARWGKPRDVAVPAGYIAGLSTYRGLPALAMVPAQKDKPVRIVTVGDGKLIDVAEIPMVKKGAITAAWLCELAGRYYVFLSGPGRLWEVTLAASGPTEPKELMNVGEGAIIRSHIYVTAMGVSAVVMVALGVTWLVLRARRIGKPQ
jgi:hypothetical protein